MSAEIRYMRGITLHSKCQLRLIIHYVLGWFGVISGQQYPKLDMVDPKVHVGSTASPSGALTPA